MNYYDMDNAEDQRRLMGDNPLGVIPRQTRYGDADAVGIPFGEVAEAYPDKLVDLKDAKEIIQHCHDEQLFPIYHQQLTWAPTDYEWTQDGLGYCHTEDTEVLSNRGWIKFPEYRESDLLGTVSQTTKALEFQAPSQMHALDYNGEMIYSTNRRMDFGVTPNHRMYVRKFGNKNRTLNDHYEFVAAKDLGWYAGLMPAPSGFLGTELVEVEIPSDRMYDGDDFLAMLAMIIGDGFAGSPDSRKTKNSVSFCCFDERHHDRIASLAYRVGFHERPSQKGVFIRYDAGALAAWIRANCYTGKLGALNKKIPDIIKWVSERQIKHFLTWYPDQDRKQPLSMYYSSSRQIIDDLQELLLRIGKRSTPSWAPARSTVMKTGHVIKSKETCSLVVGQTDRLCIDKQKHIEQDHYNGTVFCATVPNSTLVTRRNGSVLISGNCWTWSGTGDLMNCQAREGKRVASTDRLAPVSMGWLVNWRNKGNYLESFIRGAQERGIAPASFIPDQHSTNYRKYKDGWEAAAMKNRLAKRGVWDCDPRNMLQHCLSQLKLGVSLYSAWNRLGHAMSVVGLTWDESKYNNVIWDVRNSHREKVPIQMSGRNAEPDEAFGFNSTITA